MGAGLDVSLADNPGSCCAAERNCLVLVPAEGNLHRAQASVVRYAGVGIGHGNMARNRLVCSVDQRHDPHADLEGRSLGGDWSIVALVRRDGRGSAAGVHRRIRFHNSQGESELIENSSQAQLGKSYGK